MNASPTSSSGVYFYSALPGRCLAALFALSTLFIGCSDGAEPDPQPNGGGSGNSMADAGSPNALGGEAATGEAGATGSEGGTATGSGGAAGGDQGASGAPATGGANDPGTDIELGDSDGITGTFEGARHTHTFNATTLPQQTDTVVLTATSAWYPLYDAWSIRLLPELGTQACTGDVGTEDISITFGAQTDYNASGTSAMGACSITVTSIGPKFEGTFTATLVTPHGDVEVTDGAFRVPGGI